jgi:hypothetical protein
MSLPRYQRRKSSRKRYVLLALGLCIIAVVVGGYVWATSGNQGEIAEMNQTAAPKPVTDQVYEGKLLRFTYKGTYQLKTVTPSGGDLELASLRADTMYEKTLAVSVSPLPDNKPESNSSYNMRKVSPDTYKVRTLAVHGGTAIIFVKGESEQTAFVQRPGRIAVFSFTTTPGNFDDLQPEVDSLLHSLEWKE